MSEVNFIHELAKNKQRMMQNFPNKQGAQSLIVALFDFLFVNQSAISSEEEIEKRYDEVKQSFTALLNGFIADKAVVENHSILFFKELPAIYQELLNDAVAILESDPAARSISEVIFAYPGFFATAVYRLSHQLWKQELQHLARLFCEFAHSKTGIDIHPAAIIGKGFSIDHGTGIVVGETTVIGNNVKLYQGVTLGALSVEKNKASTKRHPTIEDDVVIYSGATILGGSTVIGSGSIIGGNVWLTYSVPGNSVVYHKSEVKVKDKNPFPEPLNFVI